MRHRRAPPQESVDRDRFSLSPDCHGLLHPIALGIECALNNNWSIAGNTERLRHNCPCRAQFSREIIPSIPTSSRFAPHQVGSLALWGHTEGTIEKMKSIPTSVRKRSLLLVVTTQCSLLAAGFTASAADIPARVNALPPAPIFTQAPAFAWTGFYVGVNAGAVLAGRNNASAFVTPPATGLNSIGVGHRIAPVLGLQAGYNWQVGNLVAGIEADIQALGAGKHRIGPATLPDGTIVNGRSSGQWYGTLRPRVGYAFDRTLVYVTGGLAYGGSRNSLLAVDGVGKTALLRSDKTRIGWALGGGLEYAMSRNWSAKLEYQYVNLGTEKLAGAVFTPGGVATGATVTSRHQNDFQTIKAGLNYRF